jgi:hypothetical protein
MHLSCLPYVPRASPLYSSWLDSPKNIWWGVQIIKPIPTAALYGVGLQPLACWDCGFESRRGHGCLSLVSAVCCQVEVSAKGRSLVQRSPTECGVSECDREASIMRGSGTTRAVEPWK